MTYFEALYGGQHYEISQRGGDTKAGRMNGNIFLAALIILLLIDIILIGLALDNVFRNELTANIHRWFGEMSGRSIGKLLAIVLFAVLYFVIIKTIGSESNYNRLVNNFMQYPEEVKEKAKWKALIPFGILIVVLMISVFLK